MPSPMTHDPRIQRFSAHQAYTSGPYPELRPVTWSPASRFAHDRLTQPTSLTPPRPSLGERIAEEAGRRVLRPIILRVASSLGLGDW